MVMAKNAMISMNAMRELHFARQLPSVRICWAIISACVRHPRLVTVGLVSGILSLRMWMMFVVDVTVMRSVWTMRIVNVGMVLMVMVFSVLCSRMRMWMILFRIVEAQVIIQNNDYNVIEMLIRLSITKKCYFLNRI